jgi:hypothetical protein
MGNMKNFLAFIGLLVVLIIGVGIWQGWFKFSVSDDKKVNIEADGKKITDDLKTGIDKAKVVGGEFVDKAKDSMKKTESGPAAGTPGPSGK